MTFRTPVKFLRAMGELARKKLVPTWLGSADLRGLDAAVRRQAIFSARMTQIRALQAVADGVKAMLAGEGNLADAKLLLGETLQALGYDAEKGFPGDKPDQVPPATRGTLTDLASERRKTLIIDTQYKMAANAAFVKAGTEDEQRRYQWPCYELVRIGRRRTPRGLARRKGGLVPKPGDDWPSRFVAAGGELYDKGTRMIAPKGSDVWIKLGEGEGGYMDTLGNPYAPFAFNSGYGLREVARNECLLLGVISPDDTISKVPVKLATTLKAQAKGLDPELLKAFKKDLVTREDGSVRLKRMMDAELARADAAYNNSALHNRVGLLHDLALMNMGTRAGALLGWITRRMGKMQAGQAYDQVKGRKGMMRGKLPLNFVPFKKVDSAEAARVKKATGLDIGGLRHAVDTDSIRHIHKQHGDAKKEKARGQHAVTRESFTRLHQLLSDPRTVTTLEKPGRHGLKRIQHVGRIGKKKYTLIEEVHPTYLRAVTLHIGNKKVITVADVTPARVPPPYTSETRRDMPQDDTLQRRCKLLLGVMQGRPNLAGKSARLTSQAA